VESRKQKRLLKQISKKNDNAADEPFEELDEGEFNMDE
jgi:hypothetical protein